MLTSEEIKHIAKLARIKITEKEEEHLKKELSSILDYVNKLSEVSTEDIEPLYQTTGLVNSTRDDDYRANFVMEESLNSKLIGQASHKENNFIKVKPVLRK